MQVGSLVELVKDDHSLHTLANMGNIVPVMKLIYEIRDIFPDNITKIKIIRLVEIVNKKMKFMNGRVECAFKADLFKELQEPIEIAELLEQTHLLEMVE